MISSCMSTLLIALWFALLLLKQHQETIRFGLHMLWDVSNPGLEYGMERWNGK